MTDGYGMKYGDLLMYYDHDTSSWKMCQEYLQRTKGKPLKELSKILPRAGVIDLNGKLYQQEQLVQHTLEKDSSELEHWETPNTMDHLPPRKGEALENALYRGDKEKKSKRKSTGNLRENPELIGKRLNYGWVARLMGFPDGWLD